MVTSLPISSPSAGNSPSSDDSFNHPHTPLSPNSHSVNLPPPPQSADSQPGVGHMKRKPSRRANTAERRATHNAVERQRRETLNGRFLDLAGLLPNLSQIRRPSKSSIVNSSIAHIQASRRHRLLASRELRLLKLESDALRREINEWRSRSGISLVEEPVRGEGFTMVLSGEIEVLTTVADEDEENGQDYDGYDEGNDEFGGMGMDDSSERHQVTNVAMIKTAAPNTFVQKLPSNGGTMGHLMSSCGPMIAPSPTNVSFENPAMASLYEPSSHHPTPTTTTTTTANQQQLAFLQQMNQEPISMDKWSSSPVQQLYAMQPQQRTLFASSPSSAQGLTPPPTATSSSAFNDSFFASLRRHQPINSMQQGGGGGGGMGRMYGSPIEGDDASSGSGSVHGGGGRRRSGSSSNGSNGYVTPPRASPTGGFDMASVMGGGGGGGEGRRASGLHINTGSWRSELEGGGIGIGMGMGMGGGGGMGINSLMKQNLNPLISVGGDGGGGGGGGGFMSMMY